MDLVETCILTLILCSWTAIHMDIPIQNQKQNWTLKRLQYTLAAILIPEWFLGIAFNELWESRLVCLELKKVELARAEQGVSADGNHTPTVQSLPKLNDTAISPENHSHGNLETHCTNDQAHNLNVFRGCIKKIGGLWYTICESWRIVFPPELVHGFYTEMGGFQLVSDLGEGRDLPDGFEGRVTSKGAIELARIGLLPKVSLKLIEDQSKSDKLGKVLVCLQASWMIIQCIDRVAQSIPLTLLEVNTLVNATCAFFMYLLWFWKPQDVMVPMEIRVDDEMLKMLQDIGEAQQHPFMFADPKNYGLQINESGIIRPGDRQLIQLLMTWLMTTLYGGVHLTVWKGHFPTNLERILWITSAISIMVMPFLAALLLFLLAMIENKHCEDLLLMLGLLLYCCVRIYLFVECFASVRSLPLGSYNAIPWASFIPHF